MFRRLFWSAYWVIVALFFTTAVTVKGAQYLLPALLDNNQYLIAKLKTLGVDQLSYTSTSLTWHNLSRPSFALSDLDLTWQDTRNRYRATLNNLELELDLAASIEAGQLVIRQFKLVEPQLEVSPLPSVVTAQPPMPSADESARELTGMISQLPMVLTRVFGSVADYGQLSVQGGRVTHPALTIDQLELLLGQSSDGRRLSLTGEYSRSGSYAASGWINLAATNRDTGQIDLDLQYGGWLQLLSLEPRDAPQFKATHRIRASILGDYWQSADWLTKGELQEQGRAPLLLDLKAKVGLLPNRRPVLEIGTLALQDGAGRFEANNLLLLLESGVAEIQFPELDLGGLVARLAERSPALIPSSVSDALKGLKPAGLLHRGHLVIPLGEPSQLQLDGDLMELSISAWSGAPKIQGVRGRLRAGMLAGELSLASDQFLLHLPMLKTDEWSFTRAKGRVQWVLDHQDAVIQTDRVELEQQDLDATGYFRLQLPFDRAQQSDLSLLLSVRDTPFKALSAFIPPKEVGEAATRWLSQAIRSGVVEQGHFLLNGNTRASVAGYQPPVVQLAVAARDIDFKFDRAWPEVTGDEFALYMKQGRMSGVSHSARIFDLPLQSAWFSMVPGGPIEIQGVAKGVEAHHLNGVFGSRPLRPVMGVFSDDWRFQSGEVDAAMRLRIDLNGGAPDIRMIGNLSEVGLYSKSLDLAVRRISGPIRFRPEGGITIPSARATVWKQPIVARFSTQGGISKPVFQLEVTGKTELAPVLSWQRMPAFGRVSGEIPFRLNLTLCDTGAECGLLSINSNLRGVSIDAPPPLGKAPETVRPFHLELRPTAEGMRWRVADGDLFEGALQFSTEQLQSASLAVGDLTLAEPPARGARFDAVLDQFDVHQWRAFGEDLKGLLRTDEPGDSEGLPVSGQISTSDMKVGPASLGAVTAKVRRDKQLINVTLSGAQVAGEILVPNDESKTHRIILDRLYLKLPSTVVGTDAKETAEPPDPLHFPVMEVHLKDLRVDQMDLGEWQARTRKEEGALVIDRFRGEISDTVFSGKGRWQSAPEYKTYLTLEASGQNLAKLLKALDQPEAIVTERLDAEMDINWPGAPWDFDLGKLDGRYQLQLRDGRILETGGGSGVLKLLSVFNLQALGRRLSLDFNDLTAEGIPFELASGRYVVTNGVASTVEPFELVGPLVSMTFDGDLDLGERSINQQVRVTLPISGNLSLVSVLLGQPYIAGVVLLLEQLTDGGLNKASSIRYHLTGSWEAPEVDVNEFEQQRTRSAARQANPIEDIQR